MGHGPFVVLADGSLVKHLDPAVDIAMRAHATLPEWLHQAELTWGTGLVERK